MGGNPPVDKEKDQKEKEVTHPLSLSGADHPETKAQMGTPSTRKNRQKETSRSKHGVQTPHRYPHSTL